LISLFRGPLQRGFQIINDFARDDVRR